jgi:aspartyl protease family protein
MAGIKFVIYAWIAGVTAGSLSGAAISIPSSAMMVSPVAAPSAAETTGKKTFSRAHDGMFYVTAHVNGTPVRFLVDTGANVVVLKDEDARRVGVMPGKENFDGRVDTANGQSQVAWVKLRNIRIAGRTVRDIDAAVPNGDLKVSLLGQNLLSRLDTMTIEREQLTFR